MRCRMSAFLVQNKREEMDYKQPPVGISLLFSHKWQRGSLPRVAFLVGALETSARGLSSW